MERAKDKGMTDLEFQVLDELYFVKQFEVLQSETALAEPALRNALQQLLEKEYIKCLKSPAEEVFADELNFAQDYRQYFYLATKKGLLAHNTL